MKYDNSVGLRRKPGQCYHASFMLELHIIIITVDLFECKNVTTIFSALWSFIAQI